MRKSRAKRDSRSRVKHNSVMRLPFAIVTVCMNVLLSTTVFIVFYAFYGCWNALTRLVRGSETFSHPAASLDKRKADVVLADDKPLPQRA